LENTFQRYLPRRENTAKSEYGFNAEAIPLWSSIRSLNIKLSIDTGLLEDDLVWSFIYGSPNIEQLSFSGFYNVDQYIANGCLRSLKLQDQQFLVENLFSILSDVPNLRNLTLNNIRLESVHYGLRSYQHNYHIIL